MVLDNLLMMARAVERNWCAAWATLGAVSDEPRTMVDDIPAFLRVYTPGQPESLLNIVLRYEAPGPVTRNDVERAIAPYRAHHLPFQWWQLMGGEPAGLRDQLRALGMQSWGGVPAMALDLAGWKPQLPPLPYGVACGHIATVEEAHAALAIICEVFIVPMGPMSRWTTRNPAFSMYQASWQGHIVSTLAVLRDRETVGVYHVATVGWARRRGIASHLLTLALGEAQATGCTRATLTATPEARRMYELLGFRACGMIDQWMPGPRLMNELLYDGYTAMRE
ncbi:MAG TPA: GNAT family N-acetyltransferase [Ktedonobacterales bacterium]|jgi:GNAT superfamily N-acetyltransferase|nr:GNAT family N-acetyltransferase [Ktedonobacterales bacterium]